MQNHVDYAELFRQEHQDNGVLRGKLNQIKKITCSDLSEKMVLLTISLLTSKEFALLVTTMFCAAVLCARCHAIDFNDTCLCDAL